LGVAKGWGELVKTAKGKETSRRRGVGEWGGCGGFTQNKVKVKKRNVRCKNGWAERGKNLGSPRGIRKPSAAGSPKKEVKKRLVRLTHNGTKPKGGRTGKNRGGREQPKNAGLGRLATGLGNWETRKKPSGRRLAVK